MIPEELYNNLLEKYEYRIFGGTYFVDIMNPLYTISFDINKFPRRFQHILRYLKIISLGPLLNLPYTDLINLPNLGKTSIAEAFLIIDKILQDDFQSSLSPQLISSKYLTKLSKITTILNGPSTLDQLKDGSDSSKNGTPLKTTFVEALESEIEKIHPERKEKLVLRIREGLTLITIANKFGVTKERIRQIVQREIKLLVSNLAPYKGSLDQDIIEWILAHPGLVNYNFFTPKVLDPSFAYALAVNMYPDLPLLGNKLNLSLTSVNKKHRQFLEKISSILSYERMLKFGDFVNLLYNAFPTDIMKALLVVLSWDEIVISKGQFSYQISLRPKFLLENLSLVLNESQIPLTLEEIALRTESRNFNRLTLKYGLEYNTQFFRIDKDRYGIEKHLSLSSTEIEFLHKTTTEILSNRGRSTNINLLYDKLYPSFPKLRSRYELYSILKNSGHYISHRGMSLSLSSFAKNVREVKEIVLELLAQREVPIHRSEIIQKINEERSFNRSGWASIVKTIKGVQSYQPNYYGLASQHNTNLKFLSGNEDFLIRAMEEHICPHTSYENVLEFFRDYDVDKVQEVLNGSNKIKILESVGKVKFLVCTDWVYGTVVKTILFHNDSAVMSENLLKSYLKTLNLHLRRKYLFINSGIVYLALKGQFVLLNEQVLQRREFIIHEYVKLLNDSGSLLSYEQIAADMGQKLNLSLSKYEIEAIYRIWIKPVVAKASTK